MDGGFNEGTEDNVEETIESEESTNESIEVICDEIEPLETVEPLETIEDDNKIENVEAVNVEIPVIELEEENIKGKVGRDERGRTQRYGRNKGGN